VVRILSRASWELPLRRCLTFQANSTATSLTRQRDSYRNSIILVRRFCSESPDSKYRKAEGNEIFNCADKTSAQRTSRPEKEPFAFHLLGAGRAALEVTRISASQIIVRHRNCCDHMTMLKVIELQLVTPQLYCRPAYLLIIRGAYSLFWV
jgi:hypothetical protein